MTTNTSRPVVTKRPCVGCPFSIRDKAVGLGYARRAEIAESLERGEYFWCHETVDYDEYDEDEDGDINPSPSKGAVCCAGATVIAYRDGGLPGYLRMCANFGSFNPDVLEADSAGMVPWSSFHEWRETATEIGEDEEERETCAVVGPGCLAPAGWMDGSRIVHGDTFVDDHCFACGEAMCTACAAEAMPDLCVECWDVAAAEIEEDRLETIGDTNG